MEYTLEEIKKRAAQDPQHEEVLRKVFPEAFEDEKYFDFQGVGGAVGILKDVNWPEGFNQKAIQIRYTGSLAFKGFYLGRAYDWSLTVDDQGEHVLIPIKPVKKKG